MRMQATDLALAQVESAKDLHYYPKIHRLKHDGSGLVCGLNRTGRIVECADQTVTEPTCGRCLTLP